MKNSSLKSIDRFLVKVDKLIAKVERFSLEVERLMGINFTVRLFSKIFLTLLRKGIIF